MTKTILQKSYFDYTFFMYLKSQIPPLKTFYSLKVTIINFQLTITISNKYFVQKKQVLNVGIQEFWNTNVNNYQMWYNKVNKYILEGLEYPHKTQEVELQIWIYWLHRTKLDAKIYNECYFL